LTEHPGRELVGQTPIGLGQLIDPDTQGGFEGEAVADLLQNL
jgi:hypothetical protein